MIHPIRKLDGIAVAGKIGDQIAHVAGDLGCSTQEAARLMAEDARAQSLPQGLLRVLEKIAGMADEELDAIAELAERRKFN